jgi:hypothetical protein
MGIAQIATTPAAATHPVRMYLFIMFVFDLEVTLLFPNRANRPYGPNRHLTAALRA